MTADVREGTAPALAVDAEGSVRPQRSRRRVWGFRLAAVLLGVLALALVEAALRLLGVGDPTALDDPFAGFSEIHPLFERDSENNVWRIAPSRRRFFAAESFPAEKPARGFRIFCLGGSTVQGRPFSHPTAFPTWLEIGLNAAAPDPEWDTVNCGGISYASYRLVPILEECLRHEPDLFVICTGHNEFLEDRTYGHLKDPQTALDEARRMTGGLRTFSLIRQGVDAVTGREASEPISKDRPRLGPETDPILDYNDSLGMYRWDPEWRADVVAHYEFNLRRMIALAREADVPVLLVLPPSNLGDCPPFKSEHGEPLSAEQQEKWASLREVARGRYAVNLRESIALLEEAARISPQHAGTLFDLAKCLELTGQHSAAREMYVRARDCDVVPLRMISELEAAMKRVAEEEAVPLLDAHELLEARVPEGILDDSQLIDHIHPLFGGHREIAGALMEMMHKEGLVELPEDWRPTVEAAWDAHYATLPYGYFRRGERELQALRNWTKGTADGPPARERFPWRD